MKKRIRALALLCVLLLMTALIAGCSSTTPSPSAAAPAESSAPAESAAPAAPAYEYKMPIADAPYTISAWRYFTSTHITSPNEILANIELEKRTNIHIDYKLAPEADAVTQYNLLITSGDFTDLIFQGVNGGTPNYTGGLDKAIADGVIIELTDVIDKWMPSLKAFMVNNDDIRKQTHTDAGNIGAFICIQNGNQPSWVGPAIRVDLLNKVGITEIPQTYDDVYVALSKFKN